MSRKLHGKAATLAVTLASCALLVQGSVFAQTAGAVPEQAAERSIGTLGGVNIVAGVRLWANQWEIVTVERVPIAVAPGTVVLQDTLVTNTSSLEIVPIPFVAARAGDFLASFYYFPRTSYDSGSAAIGTVDRDEYDLSLGYSIPSSLTGLPMSAASPPWKTFSFGLKDTLTLR